jgi:hypothetical protein
MLQVGRSPLLGLSSEQVITAPILRDCAISAYMAGSFSF